MGAMGMKSFLKSNKSILKRILTLVLVGILCMPLFSYSPLRSVKAKESGAITYEYYTVTLGKQIKPGWIFVGTYLMSLKGATPQIYKSALKSRDTFNQPIAFYKSELDRGNWKNVEGAESLSTILPSAETVREETLYPYYITAVIGDDGIPKDPVSGKRVDIFNINSPYEMENLPELKELHTYFENGELQKSSSSSNQYLYSVLNSFFESDNLESFDRKNLDMKKAYSEYAKLKGDGREENLIKIEELWSQSLLYNPNMYPEEYKDIMLVMQNWSNIREAKTDEIDAEMESMNKLYTRLQEMNLPDEADAALTVEAGLDAGRKARIYSNLVANKNIIGSYDTEEEIENFGVGATLLFLKAAAQKGNPDFARKFPYTRYGVIKIPLLNQYIYKEFKEVPELTKLVDGAIDECKEANAYYKKQMLLRGTTVAEYVEYLLAKEIIKNANDIDKVMPSLQMYVDWKNIKNNDVVHSDRELSTLSLCVIPLSAWDFANKKTEEAVDDYQFYIRAYSYRGSKEDNIRMVNERIEYANSLEEEFKAANKEERLNAHIKWLRNFLKTVEASSENKGDDGDSNAKLKAELNKAIDEGDLVKAKKIESYLKKLDPKALNSENNTNSSKSKDANLSGRKSAVELIENVILNEIKNDDYDPTRDFALYKRAGGDIEKLLGNMGIEINPNLYSNNEDKEASDEEGASSNEDNTGKDITTSDIEGVINEVLGDKDNMSAKDQVIAAAALQDVLDEDYTEAVLDYIKQLLDKMLREENPYIYRKYMRDLSAEYVSLGAIDNCRNATGFRYVDEKNADVTTMAQIRGGSASYTFSVYSKEVLISTGETDMLKKNAVQQNDKYIKTKKSRKYTYILEDDAKRLMKVGCIYMRGTDYAILITDNMDDKINKMVELLAQFDDEE